MSQAHDVEAAVERLHQVLGSEAAVLGPHATDDEGEPIVDQPLEAAMLTEWVLVMSWTDLKTGTSRLTRTTSAGLPRHHENGLLHAALYEFG